MAKKYACSPFQSLGNCCLEKLDFIQLQDITPTTDIFIILDNSGSFSGQRDAYADQIKAWYTSFRADNPEYLGSVYFYPAAYDTEDKQAVFTQTFIAPMLGTKDDLILKSISRYNRLTPVGASPLYSIYNIYIESTLYAFDNTTLQSNNWDVVLNGLANAMNSEAEFASDSNALVINSELIVCAQGRTITAFSNQFSKGSIEYPPLLTSLYADGLSYARYSSPSNFTSDECWLNKPKKLLGESDRFTAMGLPIPLETLLIYIGDEASIGGAYYHGPNYIVDNVNGYDRIFVDKNNYNYGGMTLEQFLANGMVIELTNPNSTAIQSTVLSDPYKTVTLPTWGETVIGGGYKEHYEEFVNTYYHKFKFFRGIVYGLSNGADPYKFASTSTTNVYHGFLYQAVEPSIVAEKDFIESSFALDPSGNTTGLSLAFIKERNYLAEAGYAGLKNYGWREYHNVGYGANITSYFTPEIFQANIDNALVNGEKYILRGTLSNGIKLDSNTLVVGSVKTTPTDISTGALVDKIVAGDNVAITVENEKLVISSTGGGDSTISRDLTVTVNIPNAGYLKGDIIAQDTDMTTVVETLLCPYTPPAFSAFSINFDVAGNVEIGRTITINSASYSTTADSLGNPPSNIAITGTGYNPLIIITSSPVATNSTPVITTRTTANTEAWVINGEDVNTNNIARSTSKTWQYMHRSGTSVSSITDNGTAQTVIGSLTNNILTSNKARTITCDTTNNDVTKYTYICYDSSYGALSGIIQNGSLPVLTAFTRLPDYTYTNQYGVPRTMITYVSNSTGAFASGTTLLLS